LKNDENDKYYHCERKETEKKMKIAEPDWIKARSTGTAICR